MSRDKISLKILHFIKVHLMCTPKPIRITSYINEPQCTSSLNIPINIIPCSTPSHSWSPFQCFWKWLQWMGNREIFYNFDPNSITPKQDRRCILQSYNQHQVTVFEEISKSGELLKKQTKNVAHWGATLVKSEDRFKNNLQKWHLPILQWGMEMSPDNFFGINPKFSLSYGIGNNLMSKLEVFSSRQNLRANRYCKWFL